jgi:hypothetical protein
VGDFNGDGIPDLAVASFGGELSILYGNGNGTFQAPTLTGPNNCPAQSVAASQFNGDGRTDLAIACGNSFSVPGVVQILLGTSQGLNAVMTHDANFAAGQSGATYNLVVSNGPPSAATSGTITVTENVPQYLTLLSMAGNGWTCPNQTDYCWRSDPLPAGGSYPAISIAVGVASNAPVSVTNQATVTYAGASSTASDFTTILSSSCDLTVLGPSNVTDVQQLIDEAIGISAAVHDLNGDGVVTVTDVQMVLSAVVGGNCPSH